MTCSKFFHIFKNVPYIERYLFIFMNRQLALPELKRYLLHCVQLYRTPKVARERNEIESGAGTRRNRKYTKATRDMVRIESGTRTYRNPKYNKAVRGRTALQKIQSVERVSVPQIYQNNEKCRSVYVRSFVLEASLHHFAVVVMTSPSSRRSGGME